MTSLLIPDSDMVLKSWIDTLELGVPCGYSLPSDDGWHSTGFLMVVGLVGGFMNNQTGLQRWIITLESYAYSTDSPFPPWWQASANLQAVSMATVGRAITGVFLTLPDAYSGARLLEINNISGCKKKPGDLGDYAIYTADLEVNWLAIDTPIYGINPGPGNLPIARPVSYAFINLDTWVINHNLGYYPNVQVFDEDGIEMEAQIDQTSTTVTTITFSEPKSGFAVVG